MEALKAVAFALSPNRPSGQLQQILRGCNAVSSWSAASILLQTGDKQQEQQAGVYRAMQKISWRTVVWQHIGERTVDAESVAEGTSLIHWSFSCMGHTTRLLPGTSPANLRRPPLPIFVASSSFTLVPCAPVTRLLGMLLDACFPLEDLSASASACEVNTASTSICVRPPDDSL